MASPSLTRLLTETASTKRATMVNGKRGAPTTYLMGVPCTPKYPVNLELQQRLGLNSPIVLWRVFMLTTTDVKAKDVIVTSSVEYVVRRVETWTGHLLDVFIEELKATADAD
jgi:hypothetical protein